MVNMKKVWVKKWLSSDHRKQMFYHTFMNPDTAPHTPEFQRHCNHSEIYINNYLEKTNKRCLKRGNTLSPKEKLTIQPANLIQSVFKRFKNSYCECCRSNPKGLDNAHTILTRPQILDIAIRQSQSELGEEDWIDQLIKFIQLHAKYPVITLCKECHLAMNKIHEPLKVRLQYRRGGIKVSIKIK